MNKDKVGFLPTTHRRCFIPNCLSSAFSDHLLWQAWALGCRHSHYSRSNFLQQIFTNNLYRIWFKLCAPHEKIPHRYEFFSSLIKTSQLFSSKSNITFCVMLPLQSLKGLKEMVEKIFKTKGNGCRTYSNGRKWS